MKIAGVVCLALWAAPAYAQFADIGPQIPFPELRRYLELTNDQILNLAQVNGEWNRYLLEKRLRVAQVTRELDDVSKQENIDPMAYGTRYAEMEAICREALDRQSQYRQKSRDLLTPAQKQKFQVLEQAFALAPVILEAQNLNLMGREVKVTNPLPVLGSGTAQYGISPNYLDPLPGCRVTAPVLIVTPRPLDPVLP